jgi:hypothetical protein
MVSNEHLCQDKSSFIPESAHALAAALFNDTLRSFSVLPDCALLHEAIEFRREACLITSPGAPSFTLLSKYPDRISARVPHLQVSGFDGKFENLP